MLSILDVGYGTATNLVEGAYLIRLGAVTDNPQASCCHTEGRGRPEGARGGGRVVGEGGRSEAGLAAHPNPDSATMLMPTGNINAQCGPFLDDGDLKAILAEAALTGVQAAQMFRLLVKAADLGQLEAKLASLSVGGVVRSLLWQERDTAEFATIAHADDAHGAPMRGSVRMDLMP